MKTQTSTGSVIAVLVVLVAAALVIQQFTAQAAPPAKSTDTRRAYYVTAVPTPSIDAPTACAPGHHMASIFEIADTSNLRYDTTLGESYEDSGSGPPRGAHGWVRSGGRLDYSCDRWTNISDALGLVAMPALAPETLRPEWNIQAIQCSGQSRVWCIQD